MKLNKLHLWGCCFLLVVLSLQSCTPASPDLPTATTKPKHIKLVILPYFSYAPFFIAQDEGLFSEQGLEVEFVNLETTNEAIPLLAKGDLDVSSGLLEVNLLNAIAKGADLRIVSDKGFMDPTGCTYNAWVVRQELLESGELADLKNLAGKKFGFTPTSSSEYALDVLLEPVGLSSTDVEIVNLTQPQRFESIGSGTIDISNSAEPWLLRFNKAGTASVWQPWEKYLPDFQYSVIYYGPNLMKKDPEAGKRFMTAYLKAVEFYNQGKTDRNIEIIAKYTKLNPEEINATCWQTFVADGQINQQSVLDFQAWALEKGYVNSTVSLDKLWDPSFIEYAVQALK